MRSLYLIRHAIAQERDGWRPLDQLRPLSQSGWRQAVGLADLLADAGIVSHRSSPSVRCRDTLLPLAHAAGLPVLDDSRLAEGAAAGHGAEDLLQLLASLLGEGQRVSACSHGDVIPPLLEASGVRSGARCPKGGVWRLDLPEDRREVVQAVYLGRPDPSGGWDSR
ncbi:MAG: SixA phosphatase family protein [Candidatus Dormibacteria bacterium]